MEPPRARGPRGYAGKYRKMHIPDSLRLRFIDRE